MGSNVTVLSEGNILTQNKGIHPCQKGNILTQNKGIKSYQQDPGFTYVYELLHTYLIYDHNYVFVFVVINDHNMITW